MFPINTNGKPAIVKSYKLKSQGTVEYGEYSFDTSNLRKRRVQELEDKEGSLNDRQREIEIKEDEIIEGLKLLPRDSDRLNMEYLIDSIMKEIRDCEDSEYKLELIRTIDKLILTKSRLK